MSAPRRTRAAGGYVPASRVVKRMTPEELSQARELLERGLTFTEVGRKLRRDEGTIRNRFPEFKVNSAKPGVW